METLEFITLKTLQKDIENKISEKEAELKHMKYELTKTKEMILDLQKKKFREKYDISVDEVYNKYLQRLISCCYQGGEGYSWWLDKFERPDYCHCVIKPEKYLEAQPSEIELEAYRIKFGAEMIVTKEAHYERWGN